MRKGIRISGFIFTLGIMMISIGLGLQQENRLIIKKNQIDLKNIAASANMIVTKSSEDKEGNDNVLLTEVKMETAPASISRIEVFEGLTLEELADKLNRSLKNDVDEIKKNEPKVNKTQNNNFSITINSAANEDSKGLADRVVNKIVNVGKTALFDEVPTTI